MKKYETKLQRDFVLGLQLMIDHMIEMPAISDASKMSMALLAEVSEKIYNKLGKVKSEYRFSFTPAQAFALRLLFVSKGQDYTSYMGNRMQQLAAEIHQNYA